MKPNENTNSYERLKAALDHRELDRVPIDLGATKMSGISLTAYRSLLQYKGWQDLDPSPRLGDLVQQLAKVDEKVLQKLGIDTRGLFPSPASSWALELVEHNDFHQFRDEWGIEWCKPKNYGFYYDLVVNPMPGEITMADLEAYPWPDPLDDNRTSALLSQLEATKRNGTYGITIHGATSGIMEMALRLRGFEQFFTDLALEPELAGAILDRVTDFKIAYWEKSLELVGKEVLVAVEVDDLGTQDSLLISPEMYRKLLKPRHTRLFSAIRKKAPHIKVFFHSCGAILTMIPDLIEAGVDILNPVQVSARDMDTRRLKKEFGTSLTFWGGGVDTQSVLPFGTPEEVRDEVRRRVYDLAPGGGFVFNTVHNIQADVPPQNLEAMFEALNEFGLY